MAAEGTAVPLRVGGDMVKIVAIGDIVVEVLTTEEKLARTMATRREPTRTIDQKIAPVDAAEDRTCGEVECTLTTCTPLLPTRTTTTWIDRAVLGRMDLCGGLIIRVGLGRIGMEGGRSEVVETIGECMRMRE